MDRKYKVGGYVKLAKLWERSKDAAVAYHSSYYAEKFRDDADKRLVGVYIDITGNKEIYKRPEMVHLLKDCKKGVVNLIFSQTRAYLAANTCDFCFCCNICLTCRCEWTLLRMMTTRELTRFSMLITNGRA